MRDTLPELQAIPFPDLQRDRLNTLQVNVGHRCNQQCLHCHVAASPYRKEDMDAATADSIIDYIGKADIQTLDITGGAPELNAQFRRMVKAGRDRGLHIIDRCNLTVLFEPGQEDLAAFLAENEVEVVASMPCYSAENVDAQRGKGVFDASIEGLQKLNSYGFGRADSDLQLNLVYNPQGASLPPSQDVLEPDYKRVLGEAFGIEFNNLYTLANMPIARFGSTLLSKGEFDRYMTELQGSHLDDNLSTVMCRSLVSVDWQGYLYDCDFNQMLGLPLGGSKRHISELTTASLESDSIAVAGHCFGCTAGQGSSCGGALNS